MTISAAPTLPDIDLSEVEDSPLLRSAGIATGAFLLLSCLLPTPVTIPACASGLAPITGAEAVVTGIAGASNDPAKTIEAARINMNAALARADIQETFRNKILDYAQSSIGENVLILKGATPEARLDHREASKTDAVLDVRLQKIKIRQSNVLNPHHSLELSARARLIDVPGGAVLMDAHYRYLSEARTPAAWLMDSRRPISQALVEGVNTLAQYITDETLLLSQSSLAVLKRQRPPGFPYSLAPVYPPGPEAQDAVIPEYVYGQKTLSHFARPFVQIDSLQPTLQWESAGLQDDRAQPARTERSSAVYDLQVFEAREGKTLSCGLSFFKCRGLDAFPGWFPGDLIVKRENLAEPRFTIEAPLKSCSKYFWTVRAKWKTSAMITASEWMATYQFKWNSFEPWRLRRNAERSGDAGTRGALANSFLPFQTPCDKPQP